MEDKSSQFNAKWTYITGIVSIIGIIITSIFTFLHGIPLVIFVCLLVVSMQFLTKGFIESGQEYKCWIPQLITAFIVLFSLFTPVITDYYRSGYQWIPRPYTWIWELYNLSHSSYRVFTLHPVLIHVIFILVSVLLLIYLALIFRKNTQNFAKRGIILTISGNFLIISSIILSFAISLGFSSVPFPIFLAIPPGYALVGPFLMGILLKINYRTLSSNQKLKQTEFQRKRNKKGFALAMLGAFTGIIIGTWTPYLNLALAPTFDPNTAWFLLSISRTLLTVMAYFIIAAVYLSIFSLPAGIITYILGFIFGVFNAVYFIFIFLIAASGGSSFILLALIGSTIPLLFIGLDGGRMIKLNKKRKIQPE